MKIGLQLYDPVEFNARVIYRVLAEGLVLRSNIFHSVLRGVVKLNDPLQVSYCAVILERRVCPPTEIFDEILCIDFSFDLDSWYQQSCL